MATQDNYEHILFMRRAFDLAKLGAGFVSPNPLVGCVIVHNGRIIGEGWHQKYGEAHAEVNAVARVNERTLLPESTAYVNLEPCSHFGKTPPCADMLIRERIKRVVIANLDSNPLVAGEGIKRMQAAGIEIITGILAEEGRELNRRFFTFVERQRPYIILKWAQTSDGFIARSNYDSKWISHALSRQLVHKWRGEEDAVLVGTQTARHDNPQLNVRDWSGRDPIRVVLDKNLSLRQSLKLFDGTQKTFCYNAVKDETLPNLSFVKIPSENFLRHVTEDLYRKKIQSVLVEGGAKTLRAFIDAGLWDEARVFTAQERFGEGIAAPAIRGEIISRDQLGSDILQIYVP